MNNQLNNESDLLRRFLGPEKIEKAPEGFTSKVMENIRMEKTPVSQNHTVHRILTIPAVSALVTVLLITATLLIPAGNNDTYTRFINGLGRFKITMPVIDFKPVFDFNLPEVIIWVIAGLIFLSIFDRALHGLFQKEK